MQASVVLCTGAYYLSKLTTQDVIKDLSIILLNIINITNLEQATVQAAAAPVIEAQTSVRAQLSRASTKWGARRTRPRLAAHGRALAQSGPDMWRRADGRRVSGGAQSL